MNNNYQKHAETQTQNNKISLKNRRFYEIIDRYKTQNTALTQAIANTQSPPSLIAS
jgi:hypothetical protein